VFDADTAAELGAAKQRVILVRKETTPDDIHGMDAAQGILTATGGMTSHAAVVARGMGKPCVSGAGTVHVDEHAKRMTVDGVTIKQGEWITLDGSTGRVLKGACRPSTPRYRASSARSWPSSTSTASLACAPTPTCRAMP
jgi:pyruvate,orthophosphate dikinase